MSQSIGTRSESSLHRDLKFRYCGSEGQTEVEVGSYVADGLNSEGEYIEVQTGNFGALKKKVADIALLGKVRIIYPVIVNKYLELCNARGKCLSRRKSPRHAVIWDIFNQLIHAPRLPLIKGLILELALVDICEHRVQDGKGSWRRKGISIKDRSLLNVHERIELQKPSDYLCFVPFNRNELFGSALLSERAGISVNLARKTLYVLEKTGMVRRTGKQGNAYMYRISPARSKKNN